MQTTSVEVEVAHPPLRTPRLAEWVRFGLLALALYGLLYFPYPPTSVAMRLFAPYLAWVARAASFLISIGDPAVRVLDETLIVGLFPLQIALDCAALDVQALYLAAVLASTAPWRSKLLGAGLGLPVLTVLNLLRIALLYFVGAYAPQRFDLLHEDVFAFAMVVCTGLTFALYVTRTQALSAADAP